jgi:succinate dehydrogenase/fumarate reductase flavoprotein subunit
MWGHETDVVVVGFGGAGATAALSAAHAGAQVILVEKNPEGGGNTKYSGGTLRTYSDHKKAADYFEALCDGATERDVIEAFVDESSRNPDWIREQGGEVLLRKRAIEKFPHSHALAAFPHIPGADGMGPRMRVKGKADAAGIDLWVVLLAKVQQTPAIKVMCSSPMTGLLRDPERGMTGVVVTQEGKSVRIRARRAVVLTCGGYEYDRRMHLNYLGQAYYPLGNPGNTGDGIRLASEIGADLWHMNAVAATFGYKFPDFDFPMKQNMPSAGFIYIDQTAKRFMDEPGTDSHLVWAPTTHIDTKTLARLRVPSWVIFDEDTRLRGTIASTVHGKISDLYNWSADNGAEVKRGWIKAADTIADLAAKLGLRPDLLQATVAQYNIHCVGGYDPDFGRAAENLVPIARPPYYAVEIWPCLFNTQGGPKRNARAQVINVRGRPIPRLYSAGELGSLWNRNYPGAGNVSEALAFGRIAGRNAAAEEPLAE